MDIPCPEKFSFDTQKWPAWKLRFQRFRMASDLCSKDEERQVSMLLYCMGEKSEDVFASFKLTADDAKKYDVVLNKFDAHFVVKRNVIFERAQFNNRRQEQGESMEAFITALHKLAETCEFGALREELIRDRIVVGIQDSKLSEKLQLDKDLTLDKAVTLVRQAEQVRQQQGLLRSTSATTSATSEVNAVKANKSQDRNRQQNSVNKIKDNRANGAVALHVMSVSSVRHVTPPVATATSLGISRRYADQRRQQFAQWMQRSTRYLWTHSTKTYRRAIHGRPSSRLTTNW